MTGKDIKALREKLGETQTQFAARFNTTYVTIGRWEREAVKPQPFFIKLLEQLNGDNKPIEPYTKAKSLKVKAAK